MNLILPRCVVTPEPNHEASFRIDGDQCLRWHFGTQYPRPFFYPVVGPSGTSLTRMGHPGAPNHDHHRSVWFAHHKVLGIDFWGDQGETLIRQSEWLVYEDGDESCRMACRLKWFDGHDPGPLMEQTLIASVYPLERGEWTLELQSTFQPVSETLELGQTNFGFLAVRVAKHLSHHFGSGQLTNDAGEVGESNIFGKLASWVDYSGPAPRNESGVEHEGITYFNSPSNPEHPVGWHVRSDGWMGASVCMNGPLNLKRDDPLTLRYLLHIHRGLVDHDRAASIAAAFAERAPLAIVAGAGGHNQFAIE